MKKVILLSIFVGGALSLLGPVYVQATSYYVSRGGSNSSGTSWGTAWNELEHIKWSVVKPGDTIYLDGGSAGGSMSYETKLETDANGTAGAPIYIKRSTDSGHDGTVRFKNQTKINNRYIYFDGVDRNKMIVDHVADSMDNFFVGYWDIDASGSTIKDVTFDANYEQVSTISLGVYSDNVTIKHNKFIRSPGEDQIGIMATGDVVIDGNEFTGQQDANSDAAHRDVMSVTPGTAPGHTLTFKNNYIHDSETDSVIIIPSKGTALGTFDIYNNVWWHVDTCVKFDTDRIGSMQLGNVHDNKYGNVSVWIAANSWSRFNIKDINNKQVSSNPGSPTGDVGASDTTAPTVSMTTPASSSNVSGTLVISASASDNVAVAGVQFMADGTNVGGEDGTVPYQVSWDTTKVSNGTHTLAARARDTSGNLKTSSNVAVTVNNAPTKPKAYSAVSWTCKNPPYSQTRNKAKGINFCLDVNSLKVHAEYSCKFNGGVDWTKFTYSDECTPSGTYAATCSKDGGKDLYKKGAVRYGYTTGTDYCLNDINDLSDAREVATGKLLAESWCRADGTAEFDLFPCDCQNGACVQPPTGDQDKQAYIAQIKAIISMLETYIKALTATP